MDFFLTQWFKSRGDNFGTVTHLIYRSAELSASRLKEVKQKYGIHVLLNLRDDLPGEEQKEILEAGFDLAWLPMPDDQAPLDKQVKDVLAVLREPETKLICCKGGRHRTGTMVAVYRVVEQGWTKVEAWKECEKYGWWDSPGDHKPLREWFEQTDLSVFKQPVSQP